MILTASECRSETRVPSRDELVEVLLGLYERQLREDGHPYLAEHARPTCVRSHVRVFEWYSRFLQAPGRVLDWGCHHGPDSCLLRARFGEAMELYGCDFHGAERFGVFRGYSAVDYRQLRDPFGLPYADQHFDAIVASGMLEHAAMDNECLKEAYRVLKPGGRLVVTYLPNAWSIQEWLLRVRGADAHQRRYTRRGFTRQLLHHGFLPMEPIRMQFFRWEGILEKCRTSRVWTDRLSRLCRCLAPVHLLASTWCAVAEKRRSM